MHDVLFVSLGLTVLDEIRIPDQEPLLNVLGGSGVYATLGARLFLPGAESGSLGWILNIGNDFPHDLMRDLAAWGTTLIVSRRQDEPSTRGLLEYTDNKFGQKNFQYTTPALQIHVDQLNSHALFMAKSFHFLYWPRDLEERVLELLELRKKAGLLLDNEQRPLIIWEPAPLSCNKKQLSSFFSALKVVDVCSPNHLELLRLFGEQPSSPFSRAQVEDLARRIFDSGVGPRRTGTVVIRAGEHGAMTLNPHDGICHWIPPYYGSSLSPAEGESQSSGVVDATGAGNAFLGAYAIGYLKTGDIKEAACYGSVAASFVLEQRGMPRRKATDGQEKWNDSDVHDRLNTYLEQVFMSTHRR